MQIIRAGSQLGVYSCANGFKPIAERLFSLDNEAKKNPEAVINRLLLENREDEAERLLELFV